MHQPQHEYSKNPAECPAPVKHADFTIHAFERIHDARTLQARFDVAYGPVVIKGVRLHASRNGGTYLGLPGHRASAEPSGWKNAIELDDGLAEEIRVAAVAAMESNEARLGDES